MTWGRGDDGDRWDWYRVDAANRRRDRRRADGWVDCVDVWAAEDIDLGPTGEAAL